jgi:hypothetical protein
MTDSSIAELARQTGKDSHSEGLVRGGIGFLGGLVLCGVALMAQAALLQAIAGKKTS